MLGGRVAQLRFAEIAIVELHALALSERIPGKGDVPFLASAPSICCHTG